MFKLGITFEACFSNEERETFGPENAEFAKTIYANILDYIKITEKSIEIYAVHYVVSSL
ncbi:hypothetical protein [uncultured Algibacter sp.]|uniref:hypothetical protein n=1 Tax=uncultured Algibacter sp. TaxID=298659 RepID=UPI003216E979